MPRTLVLYHTPSPLAMAKRMTITMVSPGWLSGCTTILRYITSPSRRERPTTIRGKLYRFCVMRTSDYTMYADFKDLVIYPRPDGYDSNSAQREYVTGQINISFLLKHGQQCIIKKLNSECIQRFRTGR